ncbi:MAG TPA: replicative DNA helicase [Bacteroidia bacterium]|nr:replicative DNA helicase [Bacteroidia bacterium]
MIRKTRSKSEDRILLYGEGKLPPQALDIETAIIASIITFPTAHAEIFELLSPEVFYKEDGRKIFEAAKILYDQNLPVDRLSIVHQLKATEQLELVGGAYYLDTFKSVLINPTATEFNCRILLQKFLQREIIRIGLTNINEAYEDTIDVFDLHEKVNSELEASLQIVLKGRGASKVSSLTTDAIERYDKRETAGKEGKITGVNTGLNDLNKITGGWQRSNLIIVAGRPSQGKTALSLLFALSANIPVLFFSLEMGEEELIDRLMVSTADFDAGKFRDGYLSKEEKPRLFTAKSQLDKMGIFIDDTPAIRIRDIRAKAKKYKRLHNIGMVVVDYLQLTDPETENKGNREADISGISRGLKKLAKELGVPVIALSQLSRKCEERPLKKPQLSDLRESGAIEQDADMVIFVYRPEFYGLPDENGQPITGIGKLIISKHRNGKTGEMPFRYNESLTKIYDYESNSTAVSRLTPDPYANF